MTGSMTCPSRGAEGLQNVFLLPGAIHIATEPTLVTTILGSCIAVSLWDPVRRAGGMCHFVLPGDLGGGSSLRYGDAAINRLVEGLVSLGCRIRDLRAKVLGGADVLPVSTAAVTVGARNLQMALGRLRHHGVPVVAQRTGGRSGILIRMLTESGEVMVWRAGTITARS